MCGSGRGCWCVGEGGLCGVVSQGPFAFVELAAQSQSQRQSEGRRRWLFHPARQTRRSRAGLFTRSRRRALRANTAPYARHTSHRTRTRTPTPTPTRPARRRSTHLQSTACAINNAPADSLAPLPLTLSPSHPLRHNTHAHAAPCPGRGRGEMLSSRAGPVHQSVAVFCRQKGRRCLGPPSTACPLPAASAVKAATAAPATPTAPSRSTCRCCRSPPAFHN